ncbi:hypothetical protein CDV31_017196, partial [Fusarium ambrosium]
MGRTALSPPPGAVQKESSMDNSSTSLEMTRSLPSSPCLHDPDSNPCFDGTIILPPFPDDTTEQNWRRGPTRAVSFDEVFQDGKAAVKRVIIRFPDVEEGSWYILRCHEHEAEFAGPTFRGARAHLRSEKHGRLTSPRNALIIGHFGVEVLNCNAELAEKNNRVALGAKQGSTKRSVAYMAGGIPERQARAWGSEQRPRVTKSSRAGLSRHNGPREQSNKAKPEEIHDPIPGQICTARDAREGSAPSSESEFCRWSSGLSPCSSKTEPDPETKSPCAAGDDSLVTNGMDSLAEVDSRPRSQRGGVALLSDPQSEASRPNLLLEQVPPQRPEDAYGTAWRGVPGTENTTGVGAGSPMAGQETHCRMVINSKAGYTEESLVSIARASLAMPTSIGLNPVVQGSTPEPFWGREAKRTRNMQSHHTLLQDTEVDLRHRAPQAALGLEPRIDPNARQTIGTGGRSEAAGPKA